MGAAQFIAHPFGLNHRQLAATGSNTQERSRHQKTAGPGQPAMNGKSAYE
jgi:hypothetical protein